MDTSSKATNDQQGEQQQDDSINVAPAGPEPDTPMPAGPTATPDTSDGTSGAPQPEQTQANPPASATADTNGANPAPPNAQSSAAPAQSAPRSMARDTAQRQREYHAQQVEQFARTSPDSPGHYVRLAAYFRTTPQVVAAYPQDFKLAFENERYQDSLRKQHLWQNPIPTIEDMTGGPVRSGAPKPSPVLPQQGNAQNSGAGFDGKARNVDEAQFFKGLGVSLLAKHFGVPRDEVAGMPGLYWMRYATEPENKVPNGALPPAGSDPLSGDSGLKKIILQNRELFTEKQPAGQENGGGAAYPNFGDNIPGGKGRTSVFVFDNGTRPPDKGMPGTTYGGVAYAVSTDALGHTTIGGPFRVSTYANSLSMTNNRPATAEVKGKTLSEGGEPYINAYGHNPEKGPARRGLNMGVMKPGGSALTVDATGPNPLHDKRPIVEWANVHSGQSDNGRPQSRGSHACYTIHPDDAAAFFDNFEWNDKKPTTGTSRGKIYTYRGDSAEASALKNWLESQHPTK